MERLHIELQRVQTWLFAVPRLRAMVGGNALLGETLRGALPKLACETGRGWVLAPRSETYPAADPNDPLKDYDDPAADANDGILARDGGHFEAWFVTGAGAFADAAGQLLCSNLPGLRFQITVDGAPCTRSQAHLSTELPVLAPCEWTGRGIASDTVEQGDERPAVSFDVARRHAAARRAEVDKAVDLASLLSANTKLRQLESVQELKELVGNGYLALILADGNGVGSGLGNEKPDSERAAFYHGNRVLLRRAVKKAIDAHCPDTGPSPLIPLMLGGDDLLLVSRADIALPFVVMLCEALGKLQCDNDGFKLTLGVGVVFAKHTIPIHRLHEVAEQLAGSAKRRFRGLKEGEAKRSVVDWAVFSTACVDDPTDVRRRDWLRGSGNDLRVLSQRPVDVLGQGLDSLQGLVRGAGLLAQAPRSQLRYLVDQLPRGRALSELAFAEIVRLHAMRGPTVTALEVPDRERVEGEDRAVEEKFHPSAGFRARWHALSLIEKGNLLGAWGAISHLENELGQNWTQVVKWLANFAASLPIPEACDLPVLNHPRMAVRAALRVELALRAGDIPRAVHGTVAFFEAALPATVPARLGKGPLPARNHATSRETRLYQGENGQLDRVGQAGPRLHNLQQFGVGYGECSAFCSAIVEKCGNYGVFRGCSNPVLSA